MLPVLTYTSETWTLTSKLIQIYKWHKEPWKDKCLASQGKMERPAHQLENKTKVHDI